MEMVTDPTWYDRYPTRDGLYQMQIGNLPMRYSQSQRRYHTWKHIEYCLSVMAAHAHLIGGGDNAARLQSFILFHDAVYEVRETTQSNEEASAELAQDKLRGRPYLDELVRDILASTHRTYEYGPSLRNLALSIDLSGTAADWETFIENGRQIVQEYATHHPLIDVLRNRKTFLETFLQRKHIFPHPYFEGYYGATARRNLEGEIVKVRVKINDMQTSGLG